MLEKYSQTKFQRLSTTRWKEIWQEDPVQVQEVPVEDFEESRNAVLHLGGLPLQLKVGSLSGWGAAAIIHQLIHQLKKKMNRKMKAWLEEEISGDFMPRTQKAD